MRTLRRLIGSVFLTVLVAGLSFSLAAAHEIADGNARAEVIWDFTPGPSTSPDQAFAWISYANPQIRDGANGFSWSAISISNPSSGDCHSGAAVSGLQVARSGWL